LTIPLVRMQTPFQQPDTNTAPTAGCKDTDHYFNFINYPPDRVVAASTYI